MVTLWGTLSRLPAPEGGLVHAPVSERARWPELLAKERPLVFVCKTDYRSTLAIGFAEQLGFTHVGSLDGGVIRWAKLGLPLVEMVPAPSPLPPPPTPKR